MVERERVLFFPTFFLPERWNGMDEHMLMLARHLDRERFELAVAEHVADGEQTQLLAERAKICLTKAPEDLGIGRYTHLSNLRDFFRRECPSVLHLHSPTVGGQLLPALAARMAGVKRIVSTYQQIQPHRLSRKSRLISAFTHSVLIDRTIAVSTDVGKTVQSMAGVGAGRLIVISNGIELQVMHESCAGGGLPPARVADEVRIGYFGRLSPEKGLQVLLRSFALVQEKYPRTLLLMVGDGPERAELEILASSLGLIDRVIFLGFRSDARALMSQVDIVVHAPEYEGFGLVMLEAMAASRPLVVNDAPGGMRELVRHGVNGLVAAAGSPDALAEAMLKVVVSPSLRKELGENGRRICEERYSAEVMARRTQEIYEELLGRTK
jgi:glycosyltransferase involved in cell wall biosynthesis